MAVERAVSGFARRDAARSGERWRERLTYWAYRSAERVLSTLPRGLVIPGAVAVSNGAYDLSGPKGAVVRANMAQAMDLPLDDPRVSRAARRAFQNFGRYLVEVMRLPVLDPTEARGRVTFVGWEDLAAAQGTEGRGVLLCTVHTGAVDLLAPAMKIEGESVSAVADDTTYGRLYEHLAAVRAAHGVDVIGWRNLRRLYKVLRDGGNLVLLVDGPFRTGDVPVELLGAPTTLPAGPALLSARTGAAILPVGVRRVGDGLEAWGYPVIRATSSEPAEVYRATQALADAMGQVIAADPGQWYMFRAVWPQTDADRAAAAAALERARAGEDWTTASR
ncbi:MAG TPA: lysophospholipid acyltransferase family protein [Candidatus Limnocylindria bacterium]|nr:lysophospholipid acyltransferase family protein [Candidatus Limnocylindria bacterium]